MSTATSSSISRHPRLGEFLLHKKVINESELEVALCEQKRHYRLLGDILIELGFVKGEIFYPLLAEFLGYPYISLANHQVLPDCLEVLSLEKGMKLSAVVFHRLENHLHIAVADPENFFIKDQIERLVGHHISIIFYLSSPKEIFAFYHSQTSPSSAPSQAGVEPLLQSILAEAVDKNASDIHFLPEPQLIQVFYRVDGILQKQQTLHAQVWQRLAVYLKLISKLDISESRKSQDGRFDMVIKAEPIDCRLSVVPTLHAESIVIRILRKTRGILAIKNLGFTEAQIKTLQQLMQQPQGLFIIAGPTGSGKTTTLYALLQEIDASSRNIVTIEDPVEYVIPGIRQSEVQPGGMQISDALRALLRHDPDVIYVSEIRDSQTAQLAIQASLTGHLVLATLHANDIFSIPLRLKELGVNVLSLSHTLIGVMSQRLIRRYCITCTGKGCAACGKTGYQGRLAIAEIEKIIPDLRQLLSQELSLETLKQWSAMQSQETMRSQAEFLLAHHMTSSSEINRVLG